MPLQSWRVKSDETVADMGIFEVHRVVTASPRTGMDRGIARITSGEWVNVIPLTVDRDVVLVRQWRHGTRAFTLEIPGGLVDPGESPALAGAREVREETGYAGDAPIELGVVTPNPAFLNNRCHTFLIENCVRTGEVQMDAGEDIEVVTVPLTEIGRYIADGRIDHALVICGFWWLAQRNGGARLG